jgi:hypothetical protein
MHIDIPDPIALNAKIDRHALVMTDTVFVVLQFGDTEITRWNVTDRRTEFAPQPGDYWDEERREEERDWVGAFVAAKLAPLFTGLATEGA